MACVVKREPFLLAVGMVYLFKFIYIHTIMLLTTFTSNQQLEL